MAAGGRILLDAAWDPEPPEAASVLRNRVGLEWAACDEWFVEDEQVVGHPRDPYHRIDVHATTRHVRISLDGLVLAESRRTRMLCETALPARWHVALGERLVEDVAWSYPDPQHDAEPVRARLCFFDERVDVEVDGELRERPRTQWS